MFYDEEIIYVDSNNKQVDILEDENGVIYVPLSRVTGIRRVVRKKPKFGDGSIIDHNRASLDIHLQMNQFRITCELVLVHATN